MTHCNSHLGLGILSRKQIVGGFDGGDISSDGGLMLVSLADQRLGLTGRMAGVIHDRRDPSKVRHQLSEMFAQRVYQISLGYEDCNDADDLRRDPVLKTSIGRLPKSGHHLASQPTLSRFENVVTRTQLRRMAEVVVDLFVERHIAEPPSQIILDFDATDDETHGQQQFAEFHGYYDEHCYLPLLVTAKADGEPEQLLVALLRHGRAAASECALAVLRRLVARLRQAFPDTSIVFRADGGFAVPEIYEWCETQDPPVGYVIGLPQNSRLLELAQPYVRRAEAAYEETGEKVRLLHDVQYAAKTWSHERRVVVKAEHTEEGANVRFVVTNLALEAEAAYDLFALRGEMENRIKELKNDLAIDRTSCHRFIANQFRVLLHAAAFVLLDYLRSHLSDTPLAEAQVCTLQRRFLKLGVRVKETVRKVWLQFASSFPLQDVWLLLAERLGAAPT